MRIFAPFATAATFALVPSAHAHPHVFVEVQVAVIYDGSTPAGVQLDWLYDSYFSLLITSDLGIDLDGDMMLTPDEAEILNDSITQWPDGFTGDLEVGQNGETLRLGARQQHTVVLDDGLVRETHIRPIAGATTDPLTVMAYDPFYYVDYKLVGEVRIVGRDDCEVLVTPPDLNSAYSLVDELLYGRPAGDVGPEEQFPEVGREFADKIEITCGS